MNKAEQFISSVNVSEFKRDYLTMSPSEIKHKYKISHSVLFSTVKELNINKNRRWSEEQLLYLSENYGHEDWDVLLDKLYPFDKEAIIAKSYKLKIKRECFGWTDGEIDILKSKYGEINFKDLCELLPNKTETAIMSKASKLDLKYREWWKDAEIEEFKVLYPITDTKLLCEKYNRSESSLISLAANLGLKKDESYWDIIKNDRKPEYIKKLKAFAKELGRTPTSREVNDNEEMGGILTYHRYFGSYSSACEEAGLDVNRCLFGEENVVFKSKNGDVCLSKSEMIITDFMIDNNIPYQKSEKLLYTKFIEDDRFGTRRFDWLINNSIIVEYFGMMDKNHYKERTEYKLNLCKENNVEIIELYPEDLRKGLKGVKEKLAPYINSITKSLNL